MIRKTLALCALLFAGAVSAQTKISALTALAEAPASGDLVALVDVSDTTQAATGSTKKITASNLFLFAFSNANTFTAAQTAQITDAGTTTVVYPLIVDHQSSGTPANGIGSGIAFKTETSAGNTETGATIEAVTTDVTGASEDFALVASTMVAGSTTLVEGGRWVGAQYQAPAGTAAAPSYSFAVDTDTGIYRSGANNMSFSAGAASVVTVAQGVFIGSTAVMYGFVDSVEAVTTTKTPAASESREAYTNTGDTDGASVTLLDNPTAGACYRFGLTTAQTFTITPNTGETLFMGADQCNVSMSASGDGASVTICADVGGSGGQWNSYGASGFTCNDV